MRNFLNSYVNVLCNNYEAMGQVSLCFYLLNFYLSIFTHFFNSIIGELVLLLFHANPIELEKPLNWT